jgi:hypothetical protein
MEFPNRGVYPERSGLSGFSLRSRWSDACPTQEAAGSDGVMERVLKVPKVLGVHKVFRVLKVGSENGLSIYYEA